MKRCVSEHLILKYTYVTSMIQVTSLSARARSDGRCTLSGRARWRCASTPRIWSAGAAVPPGVPADPLGPPPLRHLHRETAVSSGGARGEPRGASTPSGGTLPARHCPARPPRSLPRGRPSGGAGRPLSKSTSSMTIFRTSPSCERPSQQPVCIAALCAQSHSGLVCIEP